MTLFKMSKRVFVDQEEGIRYFHEYFKLFKKDFMEHNILFVFVIIIGGITVADMLFVYDKYLGQDTITFFGLSLSIGLLFLCYLSFGVILILGVVRAYYERFHVKDTLRFAFFQVLSSPILVLGSLLMVDASYLLCSVLITVLPFLGVSVAVALLVLFYPKTYFKIFVIY